VPPNTMESSESLQCAVGMLKGKSVEELSKTCAFRCSSNSELVINQIDQNTMILTNADTLNVTCAGKTNRYIFPRLGAIELYLDCGCKAVVEGLTLKPSFPCFGPRGESHKIYHVIPDLWSKLRTAVGMFSHTRFRNHTEILDNEWMNNIPVLNFTTEIPTPLPEPENGTMYIPYKDYFIFACIVCCGLNIVSWIARAFIFCNSRRAA